MPPEVASDLTDARVLERDGAEVGVERMQRMADLVDRLLLRPRELPVGIERVGLEEVADLVARIEEVSARSACTERSTHSSPTCCRDELSTVSNLV